MTAGTLADLGLARGRLGVERSGSLLSLDRYRQLGTLLTGAELDPARQGLGLGSLLLRAGLSRVDQDGVECHLFTEESRNVPLYQRYGFEIAVDGDLPDGGPHFWFMRRRPHPMTR